MFEEHCKLNDTHDGKQQATDLLKPLQSDK